MSDGSEEAGPSAAMQPTRNSVPSASLAQEPARPASVSVVTARERDGQGPANRVRCPIRRPAERRDRAMADQPEKDMSAQLRSGKEGNTEGVDFQRSTQIYTNPLQSIR